MSDYQGAWRDAEFEKNLELMLKFKDHPNGQELVLCPHFRMAFADLMRRTLVLSHAEFNIEWMELWGWDSQRSKIAELLTSYEDALPPSIGELSVLVETMNENTTEERGTE